jgi:hypothetical protein
MSSRWKNVERRVAAFLSEKLSDVGEFQRIPILGREGPDLTVNESGLVINVKSRKVIPDRFMPRLGSLFGVGDLVCFSISAIHVAGSFNFTEDLKPWKKLQLWYDRMEEWTATQPGTLTSCIILHKPHMPIGKSGVVIHKNHLERIIWN